MGGYICTHTRGKYAHTHMNVSLVSAHVHVNAVEACTLYKGRRVADLKTAYIHT